ncbi:aminodeoxychorismate synthase component 1 [Pectobacterium polonicum]|uniref:aminodeoxychorismate synthase component 1 n=1 Tax=Pectobacterium polonicum TaxID=2485124 RepID=UPI0010F5A9D7|nr:aminodeoxychorismate synthase component 1 [Pectobacterium polonicum]TKY83659.1 aminodeoxychorismate synthase component 1 [Pectobacterium polonicum]GKW22644.1 aminodeoxychorismate synthase, component I [Pectobacterium carotovorum subsp. carotovorum]
MIAANTIHEINTSDSGSAVLYHALPYYPTVLLDRFAPFSQQPWAMLLHSGFADHPHNRFDIMVADPRITLCTRGNRTEITSDTVTKTLEGDPFILLQQQLDTLSLPIESHPDFPFQGGALGLFGYDLGRQIETLPVHAEQDIDLPDMAVGLYDWALVADHHRKTLTLIVHHSLQARLDWLANPPVNASKTDFKLTDAWQSNMSRSAYGEKFRKIQDYLLAGDCYQVNLAQRFSTAYEGDEWQAFLQLSAGNKAPFSAFLRLPENTVISVSPERFLWLENNHIQTRPIKGTLPRLTDSDADKQQAARLANSEKDRAENLMIVDLLRNDIGRVAVPGSVRVPELFVVEPFPAVHHLVSTIEARLPEGCPATTLLRACFPGGSITGAPKIRAMQIIEELEPQRRNAYCGSVGYISQCGTMDTNITIRTLLTECGRIYCWAGGGIVADSQEQAEYQETFDKVGRILPLLEDSQIIQGLNK